MLVALHVCAEGGDGGYPAWRGAILAKLDIKSAYRLVPVHPNDRHLLGVQLMERRAAYYVDGMLPFGLRSAPKIFMAIADGLEWIMRERGMTFMDHYFDDFITMGLGAWPSFGSIWRNPGTNPGRARGAELSVGDGQAGGTYRLAWTVRWFG